MAMTQSGLLHIGLNTDWAPGGLQAAEVAPASPRRQANSHTRAGWHVKLADLVSACVLQADSIPRK